MNDKNRRDSMTGIVQLIAGVVCIGCGIAWGAWLIVAGSFVFVRGLWVLARVGRELP
jgi:hypothetical protein